MYDYIYKVKKISMAKNQSLLDSIPIVEEAYLVEARKQNYIEGTNNIDVTYPNYYNIQQLLIRSLFSKFILRLKVSLHKYKLCLRKFILIHNYLILHLYISKLTGHMLLKIYTNMNNFIIISFLFIFYKI